MNFLQKHIEALIFSSPQPIKTEDLQNCMMELFDNEVPIADIESGVQELIEKYQSENFSFEIIKAGGGFQFMTKPAFQSSIEILLKQKSKKRLSKSALETLSIIAYKQPISKPAMEQIRGVSCDYAIKKLLDKQLVVITGKSDAAGRPLLYGTSDRFLEYFGINDIRELPSPKEFKEEDQTIGN